MKREQKNGGRRKGAERRVRDERAAQTLTPGFDRLSDSLPDPKRLSPVCRSALARNGSRLLAFARALRRRRGRLPGANPLAFVESLFKGKFTTAEGDAFSWSEIYRKTGGAVFVYGTTRLSISVRPRFDLCALTFTVGRAASFMSKEIVMTRILHMFSHVRVKENAPPSVTWLGANFISRSHQTTAPGFVSVREQRTSLLERRTTDDRSTHHGGPQAMSLPNAPTLHRGVRESLTLQMWNAASARDEKLPSAFNHINVRGPNIKDAPRVVSALHVIPGVGAANASAETRRLSNETRQLSVETRQLSVETRRTSQAGARVSYQLTSLELRPTALYAPRQEFLRVSFKTPFADAGADRIVSVRATQNLTDRVMRWTLSPCVTEKHLAPAHRESVRQFPERTHAGLTQQRASSGAVEIWKERPTPTHASERGLWPGQLQMLSDRTVVTLAGGHAGTGTALTSSQMDERGPTPTLRYFRTVQVLSDGRALRVLSDSVEASSAYTSGGRVHASRVDTQRQTTQAHAFNSTFFVRPGFVRESSLRRSTDTAVSVHTTSSSLFEFPGAAVRPLVARRLQSIGLPSAASVETPRDSGSGVFGARAFLSSSRPLGQSVGVASARAGSSLAAPLVSFRSPFSSAQPSASTPDGLAFEGAAREARAARPSAFAPELIRQRRDEVLRLPPLGYVFTQPARQHVEERRVITKASEKEIVEVVKREVRALAASGAAASSFSRADFAGLADEVYSTLVRRLLVEKERLGLSS